MKIGMVNNNLNRINFAGWLEVEDFQNNPVMYNFKSLRDSEKIDMIFWMLDKQNKKLDNLHKEHQVLSKNQQKMQNFNKQSSILLAQTSYVGDSIVDNCEQNKIELLVNYRLFFRIIRNQNIRFKSLNFIKSEVQTFAYL